MSDSTDKTELADTAVRLWRCDSGSLRQISNSTNYIYSFVESGRTRYLRLTSSSRRELEQIGAELDFVLYLRGGGVRAAPPVPSLEGRFIEVISSVNERLFACVFEEAEGERFRYDSANRKKEHFRARGRTLGQLHALSKAYVPSGACRRFAWDEDNLLLEAGDFLPESERVVWRAYDELRERLQDYPKSKETYGLIHGDFGETNYRCLDEELSIFDFDDCCYHWFIYDLAITIYPHGWRIEGLRLLDWLLEGYSEHMKLEVTLTDVTMFCQWRLVYMFLVFARKWGFDNLPEQQALWFAQKRENLARGYGWHT